MRLRFNFFGSDFRGLSCLAVFLLSPNNCVNNKSGTLENMKFLSLVDSMHALYHFTIRSLGRDIKYFVNDPLLVMGPGY